ncbi:MAG: low molecular weight protein-tyrosine-phosphatase [Verrucomicrobiota bacterium]
MSRPYRILFVCMGNICRSPAGEGVLRHLVAQRGLKDRLEVASAGTIGYHRGNPPDRRMTAAAAQRAIHLEGVARQVHARDLESFDLILTMDEANYENVVALDHAGEHRRKIRRFCEFCRNHEESEVPDPYYGGEAGFEKVLDLLEDGCHQVLEHALAEQAQR